MPSWSSATLHEPEFSIAGSIAEISAWLDQLDQAIDAGAFDRRRFRELPESSSSIHVDCHDNRRAREP